ncbi:MAG: dihydropteroate synthase [Anaerolineales bacterium]|nr:dihydropteroate synthase [Anaerolineales bacterium]
MKTLLRSGTKEALIDTDGAFTVIGEKINPTGNKRLAEALREDNTAAILDLAVSQVEAGATVLDVNTGLRGIDEVVVLPRIVQMVSEAVNVPISIDTANPSVLEAALKVVKGKALINSVTGEEKSMASVLPLVKEYGAAVIGLVMDDSGIPETPEARLKVAENILEKAAAIGIPAEDVVIDPLVMAVATDSNAVRVTIGTIQLVREKLGVNINLGASNVSFGLPNRTLLNQVFLSMAVLAGATCAITDPMKMTGIVKGADLMMGHDMFAAEYMQYCRSQES